MSVDAKDKMSRQERTNRVKRLKKWIRILRVIAIIIPSIVCVIFFFRLQKIEKEIRDLYTVCASLQERDQNDLTVEHQDVQSVSTNQLTDMGNYEQKEDDTRRKVYLTFDDGPSANTSEILDILKQYHVKATFFVVGKTDETSIQNYKRIVSEGHTLGMHSYSHKYNEIYASKEAYVEDLTKLQNYLYEITGEKPKYVRFPGGSSNQVSNVDMQELIKYLLDHNMTYYDWNISSQDADASKVSKDRIVRNCTDKLEQFQHEAIILMHDANDKKTTVEALPSIIEQIQGMDDTVLLPITEDTVPVRHLQQNNNNTN